MGEDTTTLGGIHISPNAVATIAYHATLESYGVVGLAPKNLTDGIVSTITREPLRGVAVRYTGEDIDIDIHIIVEYGTRITSVAESGRSLGMGQLKGLDTAAQLQPALDLLGAGGLQPEFDRFG